MTAVTAQVPTIPGSGRVWFYANYHCNLACTYCLTESSPKAKRRELDRAAIVKAADEALELGYSSFGVTGGEPFLRADIVDLLLDLAQRAPVLVLSNATLFRGRVLEDVRRLSGKNVTIQISLDSARPDENDEMRGAENFAKVVEALPRLRAMEIPVRIATTGGALDPAERDALCALHRSFGIADEDHVVRPIVARGRAALNGLGFIAEPSDLPPELTLTADGAFYTPFGPTVRDARLDTDLLLTRTTAPLGIAHDAFLRAAGTSSKGDAALKIV